MFCPHCGSENKLEKYCRRCGQSLEALRLVLDGRIDEAKNIIQGDKKVWSYRLRMTIAGLLIIIAIATILTGGKIGFSNIQSATLLFIILTIVLMHRWRKSHRIARLLDTEESVAQLQAGTTAPGDTKVISPGSITEQSTLELKRGGAKQQP
jgi:hypothetical protein